MKRTLLLLALGLCGCATVVIPPVDYIHADRMTKNAVTPMLGLTRQDHPDLAPSIDDLLTSWEKRISAAEMAQTQPSK